jgi:hypothetical protein
VNEGDEGEGIWWMDFMYLHEIVMIDQSYLNKVQCEAIQIYHSESLYKYIS